MATPSPAKVRDLLLEKHELLPGGDKFALLGLSTDASPEAVKESYFRIVKILHPDRLTRFGVADMQDEANEVFRALTDAYNTLMNSKQRAAYLAARKVEAEGGGEGDESSKAEDVRIFTHRGELMLKRRAYTEAEQFFRKALSLSDDDPHTWIKLGEAIFHNPEHSNTKRLEEARRCWEKAQEMSDNQAEALYHLALYWKAKGDLDQTETFLRDALSLQSGYVEAKRELRLLLMRRKKARNKGFFAKLFGK